jgi:hypothetical protein
MTARNSVAMEFWPALKDGLGAVMVAVKSTLADAMKSQTSVDELNKLLSMIQREPGSRFFMSQGLGRSSLRQTLTGVSPDVLAADIVRLQEYVTLEVLYSASLSGHSSAVYLSLFDSYGLKALLTAKKLLNGYSTTAQRTI